MKNITILGSTGSVGTQALEVVDKLRHVNVMGLAANNNIKLLEMQIRKYKPLLAAVADVVAAKELKTAVADTPTKVVAGVQGLCEVATLDKANSVLTSVVGIAGLIPTLAAINSKKDILLANKETLVAAGDIIIKAAKDNNINIIPVDSEHSAIFQCLAGNADISRIILTASGGAFFGKNRAQLKAVTAAQALQHPVWSMGSKITIDSASLINKGFEVIEAHYLFNVAYDNIDVVIHRQGTVHSMVEFSDNSILAQMGAADMRLPIQYALCHPNRTIQIAQRVDFSNLSLTFSQPDTDTFGLLPLAITAGKRGGTAPSALNAANEAAVTLFLKGDISFLEIESTVEKHLSKHNFIEYPSLEDILETDRQIKKEILCSGKGDKCLL
ncbi:MAG: 1-deoxy-D-xylulose-5-phosphate reductoisomerase [Clostridiaceae bacterium]|nr:1-deoxy-D-xylulose-5-phosphate reductoisomerase [Clostridiaceae bacterium]